MSAADAHDVESVAADLGGDVVAQLERIRLESNTLYRIIGVIGLEPEVQRVLTGVVDLLTAATDSHACFIYLREGDQLRLRAASAAFAHLVGTLEIPIGKGVVGWTVRNGCPAVVAQNALEDPRFHYVPELQEERFQSMAAVPIPARTGEPIGAISLHMAAPHELHAETVTFLVHTASLVAGAIETAQLLEGARQRVDALTTLSRISQQIAATERRDELHRIATDGVRELLARPECHLYELGSGGLELVASSPPNTPAARHPRPDRDESGWLSASLVAGGESLGLIGVPIAGRTATESDAELLGAIAGQIAVALKRTELIERLTEENAVRDLFDALAQDRGDLIEARARSARIDLDRDYLIVHAAPAPEPSGGKAWIERAEIVESALRRLAPSARVDVGAESLRAIVPAETRPDRDLATIDAVLGELAVPAGVVIGRSGVKRGSESSIGAAREATDTVLVASALSPRGGLLAYDTTGAYRYLIHLAADAIPPDHIRAAIERLRAYDDQRQAHLVGTLETYLEHRGSLRATAEALHVHPNTVRQRLDRIEQLTGIDLDREDLLTLEVVVKLVRLGRL